MVPCGHDDVTSQTVKLWESRVTWYPVDMMMSHRTQWSSESHEWHVTLWTWWYDNPHSEALRVTSDMVPYGHDDVTSHAVELSESQMTCYPMTWWCHITNSEALRVNSDIVTYGHDDVTTHTVKLWESRVTWYPVDMMMSLHKQWSCQSHEWHGTLWTWWCHITNSEAVRVTSDMVPCGHDDVTSHTVELSESQMTCHSMDMIRWHHTQGSSQSHEWYFTLWTSSCNMTQLFWQPQGSRQTLPISYSSHQFSASPASDVDDICPDLRWSSLTMVMVIVACVKKSNWWSHNWYSESYSNISKSHGKCGHVKLQGTSVDL